MLELLKIEEVAQKQQNEVKVQKNKQESSSDDSSSESEDEKPAVPAKKVPAKNGSVTIPAKKGKPAPSSESSDDSSAESSDDEKPAAKAVPSKSQPAKNGTSASSSDSESSSSDDDSDEDQAPKPKVVLEDASTLVFVSGTPHGFYDAEMLGYFKQFGTVKKLRIARSRKTWKSKHYGFIEFGCYKEAKKAADVMHEYELLGCPLQVHVVPEHYVDPKFWKYFNYRHQKFNLAQLERAQHKESALEKHKKVVKGIKSRNRKRLKRIEGAGIDHENPEIVIDQEYPEIEVPPAPASKRTVFEYPSDEED